MDCLRGLIIITSLTTSLLAYSQTVPTSNAEIYDEKVEFTPETFVPDPRGITKKILDWAPTAAPTVVTSSDCAPETLRELVLKDPKSANQTLESFTSRCLPTWDTNIHGTDALFSYAMTQYSVENSRNVSYYKIKFANGKVIRGLLGVKKDNVKRPLILVACGVACNTGSRTSLFTLMQLFDQTPFNVLILSNHASMNFFKDNGITGLGGVNAADTFIRLARYFKSENNILKDRVSEVHVFGTSLGSHEALYTALANKMHQDHFGYRPISSFGTTCTVVDYPETVKTLYGTRLVAYLFTRLVDNVTLAIAKTLGFEGNHMPKKPNGDVDYYQLNVDLYYASQQIYQSKFKPDPAWAFPLFNDMDSLLQFSRFQNFFDSVIDPILFISSKDDPLVRQNINTELVYNLKNPVRQEFATILADQGSHCATPISYGWRNMSYVTEAYFLANSPNFTAELKSHVIALDKKVISSFGARKLLNYEWLVSKNKDYANLRLRVKASEVFAKSICETDELNPQCYSSVNFKIPFSELPGFFQIPFSDAEAQALTRWLNVQMSLRDDYGDVSLSTRRLPVYAEYLEAN